MSFYWKGTCVPKMRPKVTRNGKHSYIPQRFKDFKDDVATCFMAQTYNRYYGPVKLTLVFFMPIPKSLSKRAKSELEGQWCTKMTGDIDNLIGGVMDALNGLPWADDSQIVSVKASKQYEDAEHPSGFWMEVFPLEDR